VAATFELDRVEVDDGGGTTNRGDVLSIRYPVGCGGNIEIELPNGKFLWVTKESFKQAARLIEAY
jgi:hypothetical protein